MADQAYLWSLLDSANAAEQHNALLELVKQRHAVRKISLSQARKLYVLVQAQQGRFNLQQATGTWIAAVSLLSQWVLQPGTYRLSGEPRLSQQLLESIVVSVLNELKEIKPPTDVACAAAHFLGAAVSGVADIETRKDVLQCVMDLVVQNPYLACPIFVADINSALTWLITAVKDDTDQMLWAVAGTCLMWGRYVDGLEAEGVAKSAHQTLNSIQQVSAPLGHPASSLQSTDLSIQSLLYARHLTHRLSSFLVPTHVAHVAHVAQTPPPAATTPTPDTFSAAAPSGGTPMEYLTAALHSGMLQQHEPAVRAVCCMMAAGLVEGWSGMLSRREVRSQAVAQKLLTLCKTLVDALLHCASDVASSHADTSLADPRNPGTFASEAFDAPHKYVDATRAYQRPPAALASRVHDVASRHEESPSPVTQESTTTSLLPIVSDAPTSLSSMGSEPPKFLPSMRSDPPKSVPSMRSDPPKSLSSTGSDPPKSLPSMGSDPLASQPWQPHGGSHSHLRLPQIFTGFGSESVLSGGEMQQLLPSSRSSLLLAASTAFAITFVSPHLSTLDLPPALPPAAVITSVDTLLLLCNNLHGLYAAAAAGQLPSVANSWLASYSRTGLGRLSPQVGRLVVDQLRLLSYDMLTLTISSLSAHARHISAQYSHYLLTTPPDWISHVDNQLLRPHLDRLFATTVVLLDVATSSAQRLRPTTPPTFKPGSQPTAAPHASTSQSSHTSPTGSIHGNGWTTRSESHSFWSHLYRPMAAVHMIPATITRVWAGLAQLESNKAHTSDLSGHLQMQPLPEGAVPAATHAAGLQDGQCIKPSVDTWALMVLDALSHLQFCKVSLRTYDHLLSHLTSRLAASPATCASLPAHLLSPFPLLTAQADARCMSTLSQHVGPHPTPQSVGQPGEHMSMPGHQHTGPHPMQHEPLGQPGVHASMPGHPHAHSQIQSSTQRLSPDRGFRIDKDIVATSSLLFLLRLCPLCVATTVMEQQAQEVAEKVLPYVFLLVNHPVDGVWEEAHAIYTALVQGLAGRGNSRVIEESLPYYVHLSVQGVPNPDALPEFSLALQTAIKSLPPTSPIPLLCIQRLMAAVAAITAPMMDASTAGDLGSGLQNRNGTVPVLYDAGPNEDRPPQEVGRLEAYPTSSRVVPNRGQQFGHAMSSSHSAGNAAERRAVALQHTRSKLDVVSGVDNGVQAGDVTAGIHDMVPVTACGMDDAERERLLLSALGIVGVVGEVLMVVDYDLLPSAVQVVTEALKFLAGGVGVTVMDTLYSAVLHCHDYARKPPLLNWCLSLYG